MLGFVRKKLLDSVVEALIRRISKSKSELEEKIKAVKDFTASQDKIYARSNEFKFRDIKQRLDLLEGMFKTELENYRKELKSREIEAADDAHMLITDSSTSTPSETM